MKKVFKRLSIAFAALLSLSVSTNYTVREVSAETKTVTQTSFSATSGNVGGDANVSYTTAKGGGTSNPAINGTVIRLYQNSAGTGGGTITLSVADGYEFSSVTIGSDMATSIAYTYDDVTTKSTTASLAKGGKYTVSSDDLDNEFKSITFYCMGKTSSTRLYVNYLSATYDVEGAGDVVDPEANPLESIDTDASLSFNYEHEFDSTPTYTLVEDADLLEDGDSVIIVGKGFGYAMSTTQNTNNRGQAAVAITDNYVSEVLSYEVEVFTLGINKDGFYTFQGKDGKYIYAAGSATGNNYLKSTSSASDLDAQWTIEITDGAAKIQAQGDAQRDIIRYNSTNQSGAIFACYQSGQDDVSLYKYDMENGGSIQGMTNQYYRNVKMGFGVELATEEFTAAPTEAGVIFTSATLTGTDSVNSVVNAYLDESEDNTFESFFEDNTNYVVKSKANPQAINGVYSVGGAIQVIGENELLDSTNVERFAKEVTAAVYFVIEGEVVILKDKTYSVNNMLAKYVSGDIELSSDLLAVVKNFQAYANSLAA